MDGQGSIECKGFTRITIEGLSAGRTDAVLVTAMDHPDNAAFTDERLQTPGRPLVGRVPRPHEILDLMKDSIRLRLEKMTDRFEEVGRLLAAPEVAGSSQQFRDLSVEYSRLQPLAERFGAFRALEADLAAAREMSADPDAGMRSLGEEEVARVAARLTGEEVELASLLIPKDPRDDRNIFLEVRAGTGGDEAAIFAGDLFRMYARYAESQGLAVEVLSENAGEHGGYREIISRVVGRGVFSRLKFESGTHRVQRVPATEAQGRIHTSACTVAILPEIDEVESVEVNPADLRIDTYRSSGAGGQHVNKTDSAVRITHLPSGIVVECQDERSQHKNRSRAMALLKARLLAAEQERQQSAQARTRKLQVGSGDRSERIRTYNCPQGRVTDHRINLTLYKLADVMEGDLDELIDALQQEYRAEQLAEETGG
jgi:peptide chain release factor 1